MFKALVKVDAQVNEGPPRLPPPETLGTTLPNIVKIPAPSVVLKLAIWLIPFVIDRLFPVSSPIKKT
jgi:hypothetical protein